MNAEPLQSEATENKAEVEVEADEYDFFFRDVEQSDLDDVIRAPKISTTVRDPKAYYGPVTIHNYMAGHHKRSLRKETKKTKEPFPSFERLPLELKFMILEYSHPLDLYHLSLSSKSFYTFLANPNASGVWRTVFAVHEDLPAPPPGVSFRQWAFMLYNPGVCQVCNKLGALTDFAFNRRFCEPCLIDSTVFMVNAQDAAGNGIPTDHIVFKLLPRSPRITGLRHAGLYSDSSNARFVKSDFDAMYKKATIIRLLIDNGVIPLAELWSEYTTALSAYIEELNRRAESANYWAIGVLRQFSSELDSLVYANTSRCKRKLIALGHNPLDVSSSHNTVLHAMTADRIFKLNPRVFRRFLPRFEESIEIYKQDRLKRERKKLIEDTYELYNKSLVPNAWQHIPSPKLVGSIDGFKPFLEANFDKRGDLDYAEAAAHFRNFVADWTVKKQQSVLDCLSDIPKEEPFTTQLARLDLATCVLTCLDCADRTIRGAVLFGWSDICAHLCWRHPFLSLCENLEFNVRLSQAATSLVSCVGLDPKTATWKEMDNLDARFLCGNCQSDTSNSVTGLKVYTWRECLRHMRLSFGHIMHDAPAWNLLTPEAARFVKEHEDPYPPKRDDCAIWNCGHCAFSYGSSLSHKDVMQHLKKLHLIKEPIDGLDIITDCRERNIPRRRQVRLGLDPAYEFRCCKCRPDLPIYQLWKMDDLLKHLRTRHCVPDPVENTDWKKVQIIAASSGAVSAEEPAVAPTTTDS